MPVSPADFALWARATGNKYPETAEEKIAAAPHAYNYAKNLGKTGQNPPSSRVGGTIFYRQPETLQDSRPNSIFDAPVTPDNDVPKVSGTVDRTLTSQHYVNQEQNEVQEQNRGRQIIDVLGKTALAAGGLAAGYALAQNPSVQQAVQSGIASVDDRVSSFLGRFTTPDLNGPTTSERYNQKTPTTVTQQAVQIAKGAPVGSPEKELLQTKPVTESEVISTSQTFGPDQTKQQVIDSVLARNPITDYEREYTPRQSFTSGPVSKEVLEARAAARRQELDALDAARAAAPTSRQLNIPGVSPALYAIRTQDAEPVTAELLNPGAQSKQGALGYEGTQLEIPFETYAQQPVTTSFTSVPVRARVSKFVNSTTEPGITVTGRFPGPEGSSAENVTFTPVGAAYGDRPMRYTVLPRGGVTEGAEQPSALTSTLYGTGQPGTRQQVSTDLLKNFAKDEASNQMLRRLLQGQSNESLTSYQKQALGIYQSTGDPTALTTAFSTEPSLPINITLPGGEQVATKELYTPFGPVINPATGVPVVQTRREALINAAMGETSLRSRIRQQALKQIESTTGEPVTYPSAEQLAALPEANKRALRLGERDVAEAAAKLRSAKDMGVLFRLKPEAERGMYWGPEYSVDPTTGARELIGMAPQVEQEPIGVLSFLKMRASGGVGRQDVGGVGRRREELGAMEGQGLTHVGANKLGIQESLSDPNPIVYKTIDPRTNQIEFVPGEDVSPLDIISGRVKAVTGETPTARRLLGSWGRGYAGLEPEAINPVSFDPAQRENILRSNPELRTPEGLVYANAAMVSPGGGLRPTLGTRFDVNPIPPAPAGSPRAQAVSRVAASETALRQAGLGRIDPETQYKQLIPRPTRRPATPAEKEFAANAIAKADSQSTLPESQTIPLEKYYSPPYLMTVRPTEAAQPSQNMYRPSPGRQLSIPGVGFGQTSAPNKTQEVIRQSQLNDLLAKYTGRSLQGALQGALYTQPTLF